MDCLKYVIGLSQADCNCLEDVTAKPVDFATINQSYSGYYVDNDEWSIPLNDDIFVDCRGSGIWQTLADARDEAIIDLNAHLLTDISKYQTPRYGNVRATIGEHQKYRSNINGLTRDYLGLRIRPYHPRGNVLTIRSIGLAIAEAGTYTVQLVNEDGTVLQSTTVTGGSNTVTQTAVTWKYRFTKNETLYLLYDRQDGFPINSQLYCPSCSGHRPSYTQQVEIKGVTTNGITNDDLVRGSTNAYSYGLFVDFTYQCDYLEWLCDMYDDYWTSTSFGRLYAKLYQLYASMKFNNKIINSNRINYYTLVKGDDLIAKNNEIMEILNETMPELASQLPNDFVDCFSCRNRHNIQTRTLIV